MSQGKEEPRRRRLAWSVPAVLACLFLVASHVTFDAGDWPSLNQYPHNSPTVNACGPVGAFVAYHLRRFIGGGAYPLLLAMTIAALVGLVRGRVLRPWQRAFGIVLLVTGTSTAAHLVCSPNPNTLEFGPGGLVGAALGDVMRASLSGIGSVLVLGYAGVVGIILAAEGWVLKLPRLLIGTVGMLIAPERPSARANGLGGGRRRCPRRRQAGGRHAGAPRRPVNWHGASHQSEWALARCLWPPAKRPVATV